MTINIWLQLWRNVSVAMKAIWPTKVSWYGVMAKEISSMKA
jgi:hypothetical protein